MSSAASSSRRNEGSGASLSARGGRAAIASIFGIVLLSGMVWTDGDENYVISIKPVIQPELDSDMVIVSLANLGFPIKDSAEPESPDDAATPPGRSGTDDVAMSAAELSRPEPPAASNAWAPEPVALRAGQDMLHAMRVRLADARGTAVAPLADSRDGVLPKFVAGYRSLLKQVAVMELPRIRQDAALTHATIVGTASTYNPHREGSDEGDAQTASGEPYDPAAWTAAIQIDLRERFGGVRYGRNYRPVYALVESGDKQVIVKINDVGPLRPGRVIDLNERSMRYFDPTLERGLVDDMKITLLPDADWTPGPVGGEQLLSFASAQ